MSYEFPSNSDDVIDVRSITARVEALEAAGVTAIDDEDKEPGGEPEEREELAALIELLDELKDNGGNHDWRDHWYPITLVRESYFEDFARQEAEDLGLINSDSKWPANCINWEQAADELKTDYSEVEFDGVTYLYNS